ncbi:MAG: M16 family metallopeptidase [Alphaproteobacteria bacterium]
MKRSIATTAFLLLATLVAACSDTGGKKQAAPAEAFKVEPLKYTERTLPNVLRVYSMPDSTTGNVAVHVWYEVGYKDDPAGLSGFAHLFEHIMFKATRNMPSETFDRLTEDVGGFNNASTWDDFTNYYAVVPANQLERILWAEADRMGSLVVDQATFASERDVVKEEFRQRILASPYGKLFGLYIPQTTFSVHPYGRPGIGSIEELDAATIDDVRAFHVTYYRPDNAVLVVSGNFEQATLDKWVDQYFGALKKPERPIPRVAAVEPRRTEAKVYRAFEPNVPLPAVTVTWPGLPASHPDFPVAAVIDAILTRGESSRLYQSLVYRQQLAAQVLSSIEPTRDPGAWTMGAILSAGKSAEEGEKAILDEIAALRDKPVTQAELDEARNELLSEAVTERETAFGRASAIADAVIRYGDAAAADRRLQKILAVTVADIQRVAKAAFDDTQRVTILFNALEAKPKDATPDMIAAASTIKAQTLDIPKAEIPVYTLAEPGQRQLPPKASEPVSATLPTPVEKTLANGLRVVIAEKRGLPIVSMDLRVLSGSATDPGGRRGTSSMMASLLTQGTSTRTASAIAQQIESLGASLEAGAGMDSSSLSLVALSSRIDDAMVIAADVARNPAFAAEEIERERQQTLDGLTVSLKQPGSLARMAMTRALYGDAPYGRVVSPASVKAIGRDDLVTAHAAQWRPDNAVLVIAGDISVDAATALAEKHFGNWAKPASPLAARGDVAGPGQAPRSLVVDLPGSGQAAVTFGMRGVARTDADFFPLLVTNAVLGGGYSARLNQEIRIKRGLSYGAGSGFTQRLAPGPIVASAQTKNTTAPEVVDLMAAEFTRLGTTDVTADELAARASSLIGTFGRNVETASGLSSELSDLAAFSLPLVKLQTYVKDVSAVTPAQVKATAARVYDPKAATIVVVGDAKAFFNALKAKRPATVRIPADKMNLDSPSLQ